MLLLLSNFLPRDNAALPLTADEAISSAVSIKQRRGKFKYAGFSAPRPRAAARPWDLLGYMPMPFRTVAASLCRPA